MELLVKSLSYEAVDIVSLDLRSPAGDRLPEFTAGAHLDLDLPNGLRRSYSLANRQDERHRYVIGVQRDRASRGGSRFLHDQLHVGAVLNSSLPRNNFALVEDAAATVLIAGGIGITPIWCMVQRLAALGRKWDLHYAVRARANAAFLDRMPTTGVRLHCDDEHKGRLIDVAAIVAGAPPRTHLYCCGPVPMLAAFERAAAALPADFVHTEYFSPREPAAVAGGFEVVLARAGRAVFIPEGRTILDVLLDNGVEVPNSCLEGVCGTCETAVIEGIPDHRDAVLSAPERASNRTMMICCSGCIGPRLVLDL